MTLPAPSPYLIHVPHDPNGRRILFLGDSSTYTRNPPERCITTRSRRQARVSIQFGLRGWGLRYAQEFLLLKKVYDEIRPETVVWQLDSNDIANNVYRLDSGAILNNVKPRPYLDPDTGVIELRDPGLLLFKVSQVARYLLPQFVAFDIKFKLGLIATIELWIGPAPEEQPVLVEQGL